MSRLEWERMDQWERLDRIECDCGRSKRNTDDEACEYCEFLDGKQSDEAALIVSLRVLGEATVRELADHFSVHPSGMLHRLRRLMRSGRVSRFQQQIDGVEFVGRCRYGSGERKRVTSPGYRWVYQLCNRRAA